MSLKMDRIFWVQGSRSNRPESAHPESNHPVVQSPSVQSPNVQSPNVRSPNFQRPAFPVLDNEKSKTVLIEDKTLNGTGSFVASYFIFCYYISTIGFISILTFYFTPTHQENI